MNSRLNNDNHSQVPYIFAAIFLIIISALTIIIPSSLYKNFSYEQKFYINGAKVDGIVVDYIRYAGEGTVNRFVVILIVEFESEDGIKYTLQQRADEYIYASEEAVKLEIGKIKPMVIDGKGNCLTGLYDESYYKKAMTICIVFIVIGSLSIVANLYWLYKSIKILVNKRRLSTRNKLRKLA